MTGRLVALSTAAIAGVYAVGFLHTEPAAQRLAAADSLSAVTTTQTLSSAVTSVVTAAAATSATPTSAVVSAAFPAIPFVLADGRQRDREGSRDGGFRRGDGSSVFIPPPVPTPVPAILAASSSSGAATVVRYHDGSYSGMGENRHGDVVVTVVITSGRIASAAIADCGMQYPCSRIAMLPGQVVSRQNTNVDLVSGATMSSTAYQDAVLQALAKATA